MSCSASVSCTRVVLLRNSNKKAWDAAQAVRRRLPPGLLGEQLIDIVQLAVGRAQGFEQSNPLDGSLEGNRGGVVGTGLVETEIRQVVGLIHGEKQKAEEANT